VTLLRDRQTEIGKNNTSLVEVSLTINLPGSTILPKFLFQKQFVKGTAC